ncbi:MAG: hypothetical protein LAN37_07935 [Acidobacteriia bacterium]|nr:hypothetical protein [Terriglobia bacterium]
MSEPELRENLKAFLRIEEIDSLFKRWQKLVAYAEKLIRENGENNVLYSYTDATAEVVPAK